MKRNFQMREKSNGCFFNLRFRIAFILNSSLLAFSLVHFLFFLPLLKNGLALFYLLLNQFGFLFKLVWKNGDGMDIPRNLFSLFIGEIRGRIDSVELFSPIGFAIEMNDGYDDDYCD